MRCNDPNIRLDMVMNKKSFLNIALKPRRKMLSSKGGASMTADMNVYIGRTVNSFLMAVSLFDIPPPKRFMDILAAIIRISPII